LPFDIYNEPERVSFPSIAFKTAAWFWVKNAFAVRKNDSNEGVTNLNDMADGTFLGFTQLTHSITPRISDLKKRALVYEKALNELSSNKSSIRRGEGIECKLDDGTTGYAVPICLLDFRRPYCGCEGTYANQICPYGNGPLGGCGNSAIIRRLLRWLGSGFLIDSSGSITYPNFEKVMNFTKKIVTSFKIGENQTRVSIINYSMCNIHSLYLICFIFDFLCLFCMLYLVLKKLKIIKKNYKLFKKMKF